MVIIRKHAHCCYLFLAVLVYAFVALIALNPDSYQVFYQTVRPPLLAWLIVCWSNLFLYKL